MSILSRPYFHDEAAAFAHLEAKLWPVAPVCPHCGSVNEKHYNLGKTRLGLRKCCEKGCRKQFTVKVGTVFEQAHIPLNKCLQAVYFLCVSKKGMSAHQLHRTLEVSYKAAWFLCHRIREAMRDDASIDFLGGANQVVEADETYIGGKAKNRASRKPAPKKAVLSLVERDGRVRSFHVANVTAELRRVTEEREKALDELLDAGNRLYSAEAALSEGEQEIVSLEATVARLERENAALREGLSRAEFALNEVEVTLDVEQEVRVWGVVVAARAGAARLLATDPVQHDASTQEEAADHG